MPGKRFKNRSHKNLNAQVNARTGGQQVPSLSGQQQGPTSRRHKKASGLLYQKPPHLRPGRRYHIDNRCDTDVDMTDPSQQTYHINNRCNTDVEMTDLSQAIAAPASSKNPFLNLLPAGWPFPSGGQPSDTDVEMVDVSDDIQPATSMSDPRKRKHGCVMAARGESPERKRRAASPEKQGPSVSVPGPSAPQSQQGHGGSGRGNPGAKVKVHPRAVKVMGQRLQRRTSPLKSAHMGARKTRSKH